MSILCIHHEHLSPLRPHSEVYITCRPRFKLPGLKIKASVSYEDAQKLISTGAAGESQSESTETAIVNGLYRTQTRLRTKSDGPFPAGTLYDSQFFLAVLIIQLLQNPDHLAMLNAATESVGQLRSVLARLGKISQGLDVLVGLGDAASEVCRLFASERSCMICAHGRIISCIRSQSWSWVLSDLSTR